MAKILVSGLINIETTLRVDGFPIQYNPVNFPFFGVNSRVAGVGYNISKALTSLGDEAAFLSLVGADDAGRLVRMALAYDRIADEGVLEAMPYTAQSVILYDSHGKRQIYTDLKDIQERVYPPDRFEGAAGPCEWLALCNINFSRPMLALARRAGKSIATDVHTISDLDDPYNCDFMQAARVLFMSDEKLPATPEEWARRIWERFGTEVVVIGLGQQGALLAVRQDHFIERLPAVFTRPVVNTIGAGDALFSAFLHCYVQSSDPYQSLRKAMVFASYKIGVPSAADGFLDGPGLEAWFQQVGATGK
jgi:sugar/nucleoside kinase (ribokinase family)